MIKLIITDMDGTLLDNSSNINNEFWELYKEIKKRNIIFSVASGRQYFSIKDKFESIKDEIIFIAENGAYVIFNDNEILSNTLNKNEVDLLLDIIKQIPDVKLVVYGKKTAYTNVKEESFFEESKDFLKKYEIVDNFDDIHDKIFKFALYHQIDAEKNIYPYLKNIEAQFKILIAQKKWIDIMRMDTDKGYALQKIQQKFNISKNETMAFGDYLNDYIMLQNAEYSFAMANAHEKLKRIAKYIADSNDNNGFVKAVREYLINNKNK